MKHKTILIMMVGLILFSFLYTFVLIKFDLTITNTYDYTYNKNPCTSDNDYPFGGKIINCIVYGEEKVINKFLELKDG